MMVILLKIVTIMTMMNINFKNNVMKRLHVKFIKWVSHKMGYKIVMIKIGGEVPGITIDGDKELLQYVDITGYTFKKEPLKRTYPKFIEPEPIKPLTPEQLKEIGL
jgi:hypothetical protein